MKLFILNILSLVFFISAIGQTQISGTISENRTWTKADSPYKLSGNVTLTDNATLSIEEGTEIDLYKFGILIGNSTSGILNAKNVTFYSSYSGGGFIHFKNESKGKIDRCIFEKVAFHFSENSNPIVQNSKIFHCDKAITIKDNAVPMLDYNDIFHNNTALSHLGKKTIDMRYNYWGHFSGPTHSTNPDGIGELISGNNVDFVPFVEEPLNGEINYEVMKERYEFGEMFTGTKVQSSFEIINNGDIDLLVTGITNKTPNVSVKSTDRFWLLPKTSKTINYTFTSLDLGRQTDTIAIHTSDINRPVSYFTAGATGLLSGLNLKFNGLDIDSLPKIKFNFLVTDQVSMPVIGLKKDAVTLKENGHPVTNFKFISQGETYVAVSAALTIDKSGSMEGSYLRDAKNAAIDFIGLLSDNDFASVISFNSGVAVNQSFTNDKALLINAIKKLSANGGTEIFKAVDVALNQTIGQPGNKAVLVLSDGKDNSNHAAAEKLIKKANDNNISIYTIGLGSEAEEKLKFIAMQTGGQYFYAPDSEDLAQIYRRISGQLQNQYYIEYENIPDLDYPREIGLTVSYQTKKSTSTLSYSNESSEIEFITNQDYFGLPAFSNASKTFFYWNIKETEKIPATGSEFKFTMKSNNLYIPSGGKYMGNGIMQFWVDLSDIPEMSTLKVDLPDSIPQFGRAIQMTSKPVSFSVPLSKNSVEQSIDVFAGKSIGAELILGGVAAGPSIAAASISLNGTGGMGMNFHRDLSGNEYITRRFESGIGLSAESPKINAVVGDIQAGINAKIMVKGLVGQSLHFSPSLNSEVIKKAKAAFLLESLTLGGAELSPFAGVFLKALKMSLVNTDSGIHSVFDDLHYQNIAGTSLEGAASLGFSVASGEKSEQIKLELADLGGEFCLSSQYIQNIKSKHRHLKLNYAKSFNMAALNLEAFNVDIGKIYGYSAGTDLSLGATYSPSDGFQSFNLSFGATSTASLSLLNYSCSYSFDFFIPKGVILNNQNSDNIIGSIAPNFISGFPKRKIKVGTDYFSRNLSELFSSVPDTLSFLSEHIMMQETKSSLKGVVFDAKISLGAALGVGGGLSLGMIFTYLDEMYYPKKQYTISKGKLLPLAYFNDIEDSNRIFAFEDETKDLLDGTALLIKDLLKQLINITEQVTEAGKKFVVTVYDNTCKLAGTVKNAGRWIIRAVDPTSKTVLKSAFLEPRVINAYASGRVVHLHNKSAILDDEPEESTLYIVSDNYNVNLFNENDSLLETFEPVYLSVVIDPVKMEELNFGEEEKKLAKMYFYNDDKLFWMEQEGDINEHPDTVTTLISKSGNYAVGIELLPSNDKDAPEIQDYYPQIFKELYSGDKIWARLYEPLTGVGLDFSKTNIMIDGIEVEALWNPVENIISFALEDSLETGEYAFTITAVDLNGNTNQVSGSFYYSSITTNSHLVNTEVPVTITCYPNPVVDFLNISVRSDSMDPIDIGIYNSMGQPVSNMMSVFPASDVSEVKWNRTDMNNQRVKAGLYFVRYKQGNSVLAKKIILH